MSGSRKRVTQAPLATSFNPESSAYEIGIDEAGRGPMLGRVPPRSYYLKTTASNMK